MITGNGPGGQSETEFYAISRLLCGEIGDRYGNRRRRRDWFAGRAAADGGEKE